MVRIYVDYYTFDSDCCCDCPYEKQTFCVYKDSNGKTVRVTARLSLFNLMNLNGKNSDISISLCGKCYNQIDMDDFLGEEDAEDLYSYECSKIPRVCECIGSITMSVDKLNKTVAFLKKSHEVVESYE